MWIEGNLNRTWKKRWGTSIKLLKRTEINWELIFLQRVNKEGVFR